MTALERRLNDLSNEEIFANKRYMRAKLRKFELDQVNRPFGETRRSQGLGRAITGLVQRASLGWKGPVFDWYVRREVRRIDADRSFAEAFERNSGHELFARSFYHDIRDSEATRTYDDTRTEFKRLAWELTLRETGIRKLLDASIGWITYRDRELKAAALGFALASSLGVSGIIHRLLEREDHNRPVHYVQYDREGHPIVVSSIATRNLEMYLHDTYNQARMVRGAAVSFAQEYDDFIDCVKCDESNPGGEPQLYNARFTHSDAGNDMTRPRAYLHRQALHRARTFLAPAGEPMRLIAQGRNAVDGSWSYEKIDEGGHMERHESCTTDSDGNESCTVWYTYECDWRSWEFRLDKPRLVQGVRSIREGIGGFPFDALPKADVRPHLETVADIDQALRKRKQPEALNELLDFRNAWSGSRLVLDYNSFLSGAHALSRAPLLPKVLGEMAGYERSFQDLRASCSSPDRYPHGWSEHRGLVEVADAVIVPYNGTHELLGKFDRFVPEIRKRIGILREIGSSNREVRRAITGLGDVAWSINNAAGFDESWHPSRGQRLLFEVLGFLALSTGGFFAGYAGLRRLRENAGAHRRLYNAGIFTDPRSHDPRFPTRILEHYTRR